MRLLRYLKKDERKAPGTYRRLLRQLKNPSDKRKIRRIIRDEKRHGRILRTIHKY